MENISATELATWLADSGRPAPVLLDVRELSEYHICHLSGVLHIPMQDIPAQLQQFDPDETVVCICHHGMRSRQVAFFLESQGVSHVYNLTGGVHAWAQLVDPSMATY
jgi:rhodanese-related sulfurtransferase